MNIRESSVRALAEQDRDWWRGASIYQIYPRSFADSNGDGIGDLPGITAHLDYVARLGVDGVWLSPFFTSPMADFGYDVSDYRDVDPIFGTLADFDALIARAHALGLRVIIDQVYSHTSDHHVWFSESRSGREPEHLPHDPGYGLGRPPLRVRPHVRGGGDGVEHAHHLPAEPDRRRQHRPGTAGGDLLPERPVARLGRDVLDRHHRLPDECVDAGAHAGPLLGGLQGLGGPAARRDAAHPIGVVEQQDADGLHPQ